MTQQVLVHGTCRSCRGMLHEFLNLGSLRLNDFPRYPHEIDKTPKIPLILSVCVSCGLVQLDRTVPPDWLYRTYWYRSGINESMVQELHRIAAQAMELVNLQSTDWVLDIGANDGTLLSAYPQLGVLPKRVAVEPAYNLAERLREHADVVVHDYWPLGEEFEEQVESKFKVITAIACAYDTETPREFFDAIGRLLAPGGIAIIQFQDLEQQIRSAAFDNICHEHLLYYSLWSLMPLFNHAALTPVGVQKTPINGGSLRVILRRRADVSAAQGTTALSVLVQFEEETHAGLSTLTLKSGNLDALLGFRQRVKTAREQIGATLHQLRMDGRIVDVYGASTKGNILLQVMGVGPDQVRQAIDRSEDKWGRFTMTGIPIVSESKAAQAAADVWLIPIWQFRNFVINREKWYLERGGTMIFPLPAVEIVRETW